MQQLLRQRLLLVARGLSGGGRIVERLGDWQRGQPSARAGHLSLGTAGGPMAMDKRRVQTAVIGHADSEIPVVLPMEAMELDFFRVRHDGHTFWCGVWLGGCGQQLTNKLYTDRACHFAHLPDPEHLSTCARKASGISSADHLFIKRGLLEWLSDQEVQAAADIVRHRWLHHRRGTLHARQPRRTAHPPRPEGASTTGRGCPAPARRRSAARHERATGSPAPSASASPSSPAATCRTTTSTRASPSAPEPSTSCVRSPPPGHGYLRDFTATLEPWKSDRAVCEFVDRTRIELAAA